MMQDNWLLDETNDKDKLQTGLGLDDGGGLRVVSAKFM